MVAALRRIESAESRPATAARGKRRGSREEEEGAGCGGSASSERKEAERGPPVSLRAGFYCGAENGSREEVGWMGLVGPAGLDGWAALFFSV